VFTGSKNPKKNSNWIVSEVAEGTDIVKASV
jgi:hypothetical protein